jgi:hypothetical protein
LAAARAEMNIGQEDRVVAGGLVVLLDDRHVDKDSTDTKSDVRDCTNLSRLCM